MAANKPTKKDEQGENVEIFDGDRIVTLHNDANEPTDFYEIACVEYENEFYSLLQPVEAMDGIADDEVIIFKLQEDDQDPETDLFLPVEDEKLLEKVFEEYMRNAVDEELYNDK